MLPLLPREKHSWTDKGGAPFFGWSINAEGIVLWAKDGNYYHRSAL